ncbi:unnamed protein product [Gongylonema pulchrum]|uniref:CA domain-containing protein n=1 Tax=Gongylonema pulchrum TaxID=637853 RepID=A0A183DAP8_9BILA|nr:unnamed protein product [Gongylonema pulchrum]
MLDREKCALYNLSVVALDVIHPGIQAQSYVVIDVDDVSDSAPQFMQPVYHVSVSESTPVGTQLLKVEAVDPDITDTSLIYGITGPHSTVLSVDPQTGIISLMKSLDFETERIFKFRLIVSDPIQLTSEADLLLYVNDTNDVAPKFITALVQSVVEEGDVAGHFVAKLDAHDEEYCGNKNRFVRNERLKKMDLDLLERMSMSLES